ncbi:uncharacterized protein LOC143022110 [Oratosquilla oratoria]|uniref:uncharacterized protein LOC143022110 n=1 Tax=Oratosquilla oratoria TaxID=337810 RepID=UPI003F777839
MGGQGMAWILFVAYTCMAVYNAGFCFWAFELAGNSTDVKPDSIDESTVSPYDSLYNSSHDSSHDSPHDDSYYYDYSYYPGTYVYLSCGTSAIVALSIILAGIISRTIFNTTISLHSSVLSIALHLGTVIVILYNDNLSNIWMIIGSNAGAVLLNGQQVLLNIIHLRRQNIPVITFNFNRILSINSILFIIRTVLSAVLLSSFFFSSFWSGSSSVFCPGEPCIYSNYGIASALFCSIATLVTLILNANGLLSFIFGAFQYSWIAASTFVLACTYAVMSVLVSPLFTSSDYVEFSTETLLLAIICTMIHAIHLILMCYPEHLCTNLFVFVVPSHDQEEKGFLQFCRRVFDKNEDHENRSKCFWQNLALSILAQVTIILGALSLSRNGCWCNALLVAVATSLFSRSSVMALSRVLTAIPVPNMDFQKLCFLLLEGTATLVALIAACVHNIGLSILAAAFLLIAYIVLAFDVCTSPMMKSILDSLLPYHPVLETTLVEDDLPSGSRPHQSEVAVDSNDSNQSNVVVDDDENNQSNLDVHPQE